MIDPIGAAPVSEMALLSVTAPALTGAVAGMAKPWAKPSPRMYSVYADGTPPPPGWVTPTCSPVAMIVAVGPSWLFSGWTVKTLITGVVVSTPPGRNRGTGVPPTEIPEAPTVTGWPLA